MAARRRHAGKRAAGPSHDPAPRVAFRAHLPALAVGAALVASAFGLYLATAARDIVFGDTPELTAAALTLGVAHPPGYPVFTVIGWLFGLLPVGPLPFRIALFSVVCHAATGGVVYAATYRFTRSVVAAAVAGAALATSPLFWTWSLVGEVFPLNDLLAATMLFLAALWHEHPERKRLLVAAAFVGGIGMADHQTIALLAPAVLYLMWRRRAVLLREPRILANAAIAFALGLLPYLELLWAASRHPVWSWGDLRTPGDLVAHVLRLDYGAGSLTQATSLTGGSAPDRLLAVVASLDPLQWVLLTVGAVCAWYARRWYVTYVLIAFVVAGPLFAAYSNLRISDDTGRWILERFFLLPHVVIAPLAGFAVIAARDLGALFGPRRGQLAELVAGALGIAVALAFVPLAYRDVDQRDNHVARTYADDMLATVPQNGVLLLGNDQSFAVEYLHTVDGARPDVTVIAVGRLAAEWYRRELHVERPELVVPPEAGPRLRPLLEADPDRQFFFNGFLPESSLSDTYASYRIGLVYGLGKTEDVKLDAVTALNERVLPTLHPPRPAGLDRPRRIWERLALVDYALPYYWLGAQYETVGDAFKRADPTQSSESYARAKSWYRRALEVHPTFGAAKQGLERLAQ